MLSAMLGMIWVVTPLLQDPLVKPLSRLPLPRPVANAPLAVVNQNQVPAGRIANRVLTLELDVVEAAWRAEGPDDPVVRILAVAERGKRRRCPVRCSVPKLVQRCGSILETVPTPR